MSEFDEDAEADDEVYGGYFSEVVEEELTGNEPKFVMITSMTNSPMQLQELNIQQLIQMYRDARAQLATDRKHWKARESNVKTHLHTISMVMLAKADQLGVDTFATPSGTAFRTEKEKFSIPGWEALTEFVRENNLFHLLQKRVSPNSVKELRDLTGKLPPGVESFKEIDFSVRSPSTRKARK